MTEASPSSPIAAVLQVSHLALDVSDLERSIAFYREVLGLEVFHEDRDNPVCPSIKGVVAGFGIELAQAAKGGPDCGSTRPSPCLSFAVDNIDEAFAALKARKLIDADAPNVTSGVRFFTVVDPDGWPIELIQFPPPLRVLADLKAWRLSLGR